MKTDAFEQVLSVAGQDLAFELRGLSSVPWSDFLLNPRRLRGSDFLMRWSQGVWSERRIIEAINATGKYLAIPYGPSSTAPDDVRAFELYFERLERAGLGQLKRPDLLVFQKAHAPAVQGCLRNLGGTEELPFVPEESPVMRELLSRAILAVECENSLWIARQMPDYGTPLTPQRRLGGKLGLKKAAIVPTVILKEEDLHPLREWERLRGIGVHAWHVFYDMAFGIALGTIQDLSR